MAKRLYLLRHAQALSDINGKDIDRALSPKGKEDAHALGEAMLRQKYIPEVIICSTALRTRQTLEGIQHHIGVEDITYKESLYSGTTGDYLNEIQKLASPYDAALIIAHNPNIYDLVCRLVGEGSASIMQRLSEGYQPATLSVIDCPCDQWKDIQMHENTLVNLTDPMDYNAPARPTRWM